MLEVPTTCKGSSGFQLLSCYQNDCAAAVVAGFVLFCFVLLLCPLPLASGLGTCLGHIILVLTGTLLLALYHDFGLPERVMHGADSLSALQYCVVYSINENSVLLVFESLLDVN